MKLVCFFVFALCLPGCRGDNMFTFTGIWQNGASGTIDVNISQQLPSCGFSLLMTSAVDMAVFEAFGYTVTMLSSNFRSARLDSKPGNSNLKDNPQKAESTVSMFADFSNVYPTYPDVQVEWLCVCDNSKSGQCVNVTSESVGLEGVTVAADESSPASTETRSTPVAFRKQESLCYVGPEMSNVSSIYHLYDCVTLCSTTSSCEGINFLQNASRCDLVYDYSRSFSSYLFEQIPECVYWYLVRF